MGWFNKLLGSILLSLSIGFFIYLVSYLITEEGSGIKYLLFIYFPIIFVLSIIIFNFLYRKAIPWLNWGVKFFLIALSYILVAFFLPMFIFGSPAKVGANATIFKIFNFHITSCMFFVGADFPPEHKALFDFTGLGIFACFILGSIVILILSFILGAFIGSRIKKRKTKQQSTQTVTTTQSPLIVTPTPKDKKITWILIVAILIVLIIFLFASFLFGLDNYYIKDARENKDPGSCGKIKKEYLRDRCYYSQAMAYPLDIKNIELCDKITKESGSLSATKDRCYYRFATETKNIELCERISIEKRSFQQTKSSYITSTDCYKRLASSNRDPSICEKISADVGVSDKDNCYYNVAGILKNHELCKKILIEKIKKL